MSYRKYKRVPVLRYPEREWPDRELAKAPIWCSVDLRDGNQALIEPMDVEEKLEFFQMLLDIGFREIEIGFPAASQIEFDFLRELVEKGLIPDDVKVQVLVQCREHLIDRTFEAIQGIKNVIVHIYNSTSTLQRDVVFQMDREAIKQIAVDGARMVKERAKDFDGTIFLEYSPESFTGTELDFALDICHAVMDEWFSGNGASVENKLILNLPATVEMAMPNVYADQIEWMNKNLKDREKLILSVHAHNDRGTGVAATELALLAGADRVEGTLFGNGERTGNVDLLTLAYNMFSQGLDPELNLKNIDEIVEVYERTCKMEVGMRHPYVGELVFTAFSGSHQDAINKGMQALQKRGVQTWEVPYLPIDPSDIGRKYEPVRINSQSGKGGVAFVMNNVYGYQLPKKMHREFANVIQRISEQKEGVVPPERIMDAFRETYLEVKYPFTFVKFKEEDVGEGDCKIELVFEFKGEVLRVNGHGNGPINAVKNAVAEHAGIDVTVLDYVQHALSSGSEAKAAAYLQMRNNKAGIVAFGVGVSSNITKASIKGFFSALNRLHEGWEHEI